MELHSRRGVTTAIVRMSTTAAPVRILGPGKRDVLKGGVGGKYRE